MPAAITAVFTKEKPITVANGFGVPEVDGEGRSITLEFSNFYFINVQVPFSGEKLQRLDFRELWAQTFRNYVTKLMQYKPVIIGGDMSVAHERIDLAEPDDNHHRPGFTGIERKEFSELLNAGFIDTFRYFHPDEAKYTYWSYRDKEAVRKALEGTDYSEGALFFVARKHAEEKNLNWFDNSLEFLFEHDGHEFFKCKNE